MRIFKAPVKIRHTGTPAAGEPVWAMRLKDAATVIAHITRVYLVISFDGTAATSHASYTLQRNDTATMTGGAAITAVGMTTGQPATEMTDIRDDFDGSGLTDTGVVNKEEILNFGLPRTPTGKSQVYDIKDVCYLKYLDGALNSQGFAIVLDNTGVVGDGLHGFVEWEETST